MTTKPAIFRGKYLITIIAAVAIFIVTAVSNYGYYNPDEHYQIVEYAGIKTASFDPKISWEYEAQIRPMLQPTICAAFLKVFSWLSISDPFVQTMLMRIFTAFLSLAVILYFVKNTISAFPDERKRFGFFIVSLLLWFIPCLSVRFSSEIYGGMFFLLSLAIYHSGMESKKSKVFFGISLALSFIFRAQMGLAIAGFLLWSLIIDKKKLKTIVIPFFSFLLTYLLLGFCIDWWFYGQPVFTPYKYLIVNAEVSAERFGTRPWWYYLYQIVSYPTYFVGIPLALALVFLLIRNPKNPYIWCFLPFLLVHSLIGHKDARFMFPMAFLAPIILVSAYIEAGKIIRSERFKHVAKCIILPIFAAVDILGIAIEMNKPARDDSLFPTRYINDNFSSDENVNLFVHDIVTCVPNGFYERGNIAKSQCQNFFQLQYMSDTCRPSLFVCYSSKLKEFTNSDDAISAMNAIGYELVFRYVPKWAEYLFKFFPSFNQNEVAYLFRYNGKTKPSGKIVAQFDTDCETCNGWSQCQTITDEESFSGNSSSKTDAENPYGITLERKTSEIDANAQILTVFAHIYEETLTDKAVIVLEINKDGANTYWQSSPITIERTSIWSSFACDFTLPDNFAENTTFKVYLYNISGETVYIDDMKAIFH